MKKIIYLFLCISIIISSFTSCTKNSTGENETRAPIDETVVEVISLIDNIQNDVSVDNIQEIRQKYDNLTDAQKDSVTNYSMLVSAENDLIKNTFNEASSTLKLNITSCAMLVDGVKTVWYKAIYDKNTDFNIALEYLYMGLQYNGGGLLYVTPIVSEELASSFVDTLDMVKDNQKIIENGMSQLYALCNGSDEYNALLSVYEEYYVIYNMALSPSGSYTSYSSNATDAMNSIEKALASLKIIEEHLNK